MTASLGLPAAARARVVVLALVASLLVALGTGLVAPTAAHAASYDSWSASGTSANLIDDGSADGTPSFSYSVGSVGSGPSSGSWSFDAQASEPESVAVNWNWAGYAAYCNAAINLQAYVTNDSGTTYTTLEDANGGCVAGGNRFPYGNFTATNIYTFSGLQSGDSYGFDLSSSNGDSDGELYGTFSLSPSTSPFVASAPDANTSWQTATQLNDTDSASDSIDTTGEDRWYKFPVQPDSQVTVSLSNLPADYGISVFSDISQTFGADEQLLAGGSTTSDLTTLTAEQPGNAASPSAFSPSAFSPSAFSPSAFSPSAFSPSAFSPSAFSPSAFSPSAFSPSAFSPSAFSPSAFSPSAFSPSAFSPSAFSPSAFSAAYSSAQVQSLLAISTQTGTANKSVTINTWNTTGDDYIRISGDNGANAPSSPFSLGLTSSGGPCVGASLSTYATDSTLVGNPGSAQTVILTNSAKLDTSGDLGTAVAKLANATSGTIVDVSQSQKVTDLETQAAANPSCPYAEDLVAQAIRDIVNSYRNGTGSSDTLKYVVVIGDDDVIPFFRYADGSGLAPESDYVPPVSSTSFSAGALNSNDYLSDDAYGAATDLTLKGTTLPVPDLAVGRLVESAAEITTQINDYLADPNGNLPQPSSSLVTGYDFMQPAADDVESAFASGLGDGATNDTLITNQGVSPTDTTVNGTPDRTHSWTATDLSKALLGSHHDLLFLGGHFSANNTLAADYSSTLVTTDLESAVASSPNLFKNSLILAAGCHAGYNLEDADGVPDLTLGLDWPEAFTAAGATLISGTGYQYGDTDFTAYSDKLYVEIADELNAGTGSVAIGAALTSAKQDYLSSLDQLTGIDQKALLETTLYGLPMLGITMPAGRSSASDDSRTNDSDGQSGTSSASDITPSDATSDPGKTLGLQTDDLSLSPELVTHHKDVDDLNGDPTGAQYTWLSGSNDDDVLSEPGDPTLPLVTKNVGVDNTVLRGVGFVSGTYGDTPGITPLTGAPTTELNSVHAAFTSPVFYPQTLATPNYFGVLANGSGGTTNLLVTPAQDIQDGATTDTLRAYSQLGLRLFYDNNTSTYGSNTPALAGPPTISQVTSVINQDGSVTVSGHVAGDPSAGIQNVWVTYTGATSSDPFYGQWQSVDLQQDAADSTLWSGTIPAPTSGLSNDVFMVQAVTGSGVVALNNNGGAYFAAGVEVGAAPTGEATGLTLDPSNPTSGAFNDSVNVSATLSGAGTLSGQSVSFGLGSETVQGTTDGNGVATATLAMNQTPGNTYDLTASYAGDADSQPAATDAAGFTIAPAATHLTISAPSGYVTSGTDPGVTARLTSGGQPLQRKAVIFAVDGPDGTEVANVVGNTNGAGQVSLGATTLAPGKDTVTAYFGNSSTPLTGGGTLNSTDATYAESDVSTPLLVTTPTQTLLSAPIAPVYGQPFGLSAVVAPSDGAGTVSFTVKGSSTPITGCGAVKLVLTGAGQTAKCTVPTPDAGSASFRADFSGSSAYLASHGTTDSSLAKAATSLVLSAPKTLTYPANATLTATLTPNGTGAAPTGSIAFYDGGTLIGSGGLPADGSGVVSIPLTSPGATVHHLQAVYDGDDNYYGQSDLADTTVSQETSGITVHPSSAVFGQATTVSATVTGTDGVGTVAFTADGNTVSGCGSVSVSVAAGTGTAICDVPALGLRSHTFGAHYSGDTNDTASVATADQAAVEQAASSVSLGGPMSTRYGTAATFTATVAAVAPGAGDPTGSVTFATAAGTLGSAPLKAGPGGVDSASLTITGLPAGLNEVTASYPGDVDFTKSADTANDQVSFTSAVSGTHSGSALVGAGQSVLIAGTQKGSLGVLPGGAVEVTGAVTGSILAPFGAAGVTVCGGKVSGGVGVVFSTAPVTIGGSGCGATTVTGSVALIHNTAGISIIKTTVGGSVTVSSNSGHGPQKVNGVYPPPTISGNKITGTLACSGNSPAPTNAQVVNKAKKRTGQCATL